MVVDRAGIERVLWAVKFQKKLLCMGLFYRFFSALPSPPPRVNNIPEVVVRARLRIPPGRSSPKRSLLEEYALNIVSYTGLRARGRSRGKRAASKARRLRQDPTVTSNFATANPKAEQIGLAAA